MTGYQSKRAAARDKLEDDDTQVYQTELNKLLMESYDRGVADALEETKKALAQPEQLREENERLHVENRRLIDRIETIGVPVGVGGFATTTSAQPVQEPWRESASDYERGFIDGMQKQMQSSVDKAVNAMTQRTWVGLTDEEVKDIVWNLPYEPSQEDIRAIEAKLKEKNT